MPQYCSLSLAVWSEEDHALWMRLKPGKSCVLLRFKQRFKNNLTDTTVINMSTCLPHVGSYSGDIILQSDISRT